ncbi:hypothetical protein HDV00_011641, partial [Rhizophlyctis rosea]
MPEPMRFARKWCPRRDNGCPGGCGLAHKPSDFITFQTKTCSAWIRKKCKFTAETCAFFHGPDPLRFGYPTSAPITNLPPNQPNPTTTTTSYQTTPAPSNTATQRDEGKEDDAKQWEQQTAALDAKVMKLEAEAGQLKEKAQAYKTEAEEWEKKAGGLEDKVKAWKKKAAEVECEAKEWKKKAAEVESEAKEWKKK